MAVTRCEQGHFYDDEKYPECPHCKNDLPARPRRGISDVYTVLGEGSDAVAAAQQRQKLHVDLGGAGAQEGRTVGIFRTETGCEPVVGWLVCIEGRERGRDFRLHAGRNYIGRALKSDVALADDERVSRENHCSVIFDPRSSDFYLVNGSGDGVTVNGERLTESRRLDTGERIELGGSTFVFIPFCGEGRSW